MLLSSLGILIVHLFLGMRSQACSYRKSPTQLLQINIFTTPIISLFSRAKRPQIITPIIFQCRNGRCSPTSHFLTSTAQLLNPNSSPAAIIIITTQSPSIPNSQHKTLNSRNNTQRPSSHILVPHNQKYRLPALQSSNFYQKSGHKPKKRNINLKTHISNPRKNSEQHYLSHKTQITLTCSTTKYVGYCGGKLRNWPVL